VPEAVETKKVHLPDSLIRRPMVKSDSVRGHEDSGAVVSEMAMNEDSLLRVALKKREKLRDLRVGGRIPSAHGDAGETHALRFGLAPLPLALARIFRTKIHDHRNPHLLELNKGFSARLRAAKKRIGNLSGVDKTGNGNLFAEACGKNGSRRAGSVLRKRNAW